MRVSSLVGIEGLVPHVALLMIDNDLLTRCHF